MSGTAAAPRQMEVIEPSEAPPEVKPGAVMVGYCHPGEISMCFYKSMQSLILYDLHGPQRVAGHTFGEVAKLCGAGGLVASRNQIVEIFLDESAAEWLFMVDSDMGFDADILEQFVACADPDERPIVGGLCFALNQDGQSDFYGLRYRIMPTIFDWVETESAAGFKARVDYPRDRLQQVAATGTACLFMHRSALAKIRDRHGPCWFDHLRHPRFPVLFSEDLSFCIRAGSVGLPIFVHAGIKTTHHKEGAYLDEELFLRQQATRELLGEVDPLPGEPEPELEAESS